MKKFITLLCILLLISTASAASDKRTITVSAEGSVAVVPDTAVVRIGVKTEADTAVLAQKKNYRAVDELIIFLKEQGIDERKISLTSFNISPRYDNEYKKIEKYIAQTIVQAKTTKTKNVAELVDGAVARGSNIVEGVNFIVADPESIRQEALETALKNAKDKAWKIARKIDVSLGNVLAVSEGSVEAVYGTYRGVSALAESRMPEFPAGETDITAKVVVVYEIN